MRTNVACIPGPARIQWSLQGHCPLPLGRGACVCAQLCSKALQMAGKSKNLTMGCQEFGKRKKLQPLLPTLPFCPTPHQYHNAATSYSQSKQCKGLRQWCSFEDVLQCDMRAVILYIGAKNSAFLRPVLSLGLRFKKTEGLLYIVPSVTPQHQNAFPHTPEAQVQS